MAVKRKRGLLRRLLFWMVAVVAGFYALVGIALVGLKWIDPPTTMAQIERRIQALAHRRPYRKRYAFVPLRRISTGRRSIKSWIRIWIAASWGAAPPPSRNNW
jgi:hypothetical protein